MIMKRLFTMSTLVVATALFFASCGGNEAAKTEKSDAPEVKTEEPAATPEAEPAAEPEATPEATDAAAFDLDAGKALYDSKCAACHTPGVGPKLDDRAAWEAIAAQGLEVIYDHTINGFTGEKGAMPAKGTAADATDADLHNAVAYMLSTAGVTAE
jgi:cytochrome c5